MRRRLLEILADPVSGAPLELEANNAPDDDVEAGALTSTDGASYEIRGGIPRFVLTDDPGQRQTEASFAFKWEQRATYGSDAVLAATRRWLLERYAFTTVDEMRSFFGAARWALDAGCGAGHSTSAWLDDTWSGERGEWVGADISTAIDIARERLGAQPRTHFVQADVLQLPFAPGSFDAVFSEGVLHHTPSTERAFHALAALVAPGGELMFYVYRRKAPIREFTDDYVRERIADLPSDEAWEALRPLTRLGQSLSELHATVVVEEDVPLLGIAAGEYDLHRLLYWHVAKMFWRDDYTFDENHHANFDWYHPRYAHRHSEEEIRGWCDAAGFRIVHLDAQESGFTVRAQRP